MLIGTFTPSYTLALYYFSLRRSADQTQHFVHAKQALPPCHTPASHTTLAMASSNVQDQK